MRLKQVAFLFVAMFALAAFSHAATPVNGIQKPPLDASYSDQPVSIDSNGDGLSRKLEKIYRTPIPAKIRRTFDRTVMMGCEECAECAFTVLDGGKEVSIFTKKFIVVDVEPGDFGGVFVTLIFEGKSNPFLLWVYDVGDGKYELRTIRELPEPSDERFVRQVHNPLYRRYWL